MGRICGLSPGESEHSSLLNSKYSLRKSRGLLFLRRKGGGNWKRTLARFQLFDIPENNECILENNECKPGGMEQRA